MQLGVWYCGQLMKPIKTKNLSHFAKKVSQEGFVGLMSLRQDEMVNLWLNSKDTYAAKRLEIVNYLICNYLNMNHI
jgi:hypothetical protein